MSVTSPEMNPAGIDGESYVAPNNNPDSGATLSEIGQQRAEAAKQWVSGQIEGGADAVRNAVATGKENITQGIESGKEAVTKGFEIGKEWAGARWEGAKARYESFKAKAQGIGERSKSRAGTLMEKARIFGYALLAPDVAVRRGSEAVANAAVEGANFAAEKTAQAYDWSKEKVEDGYQFALDKADQLRTKAEAVKTSVEQRATAAQERGREKINASKEAIRTKVESWKAARAERAQEKAATQTRREMEIQLKAAVENVDALKRQMEFMRNMMETLAKRIEATNENITELKGNLG